jgi:hypothetical protein
MALTPALSRKRAREFRKFRRRHEGHEGFGKIIVPNFVLFVPSW